MFLLALLVAGPSSRNVNGKEYHAYARAIYDILLHRSEPHFKQCVYAFNPVLSSAPILKPDTTEYQLASPAHILSHGITCA